ncbi:MAG: hypothetical protein ACE5LU_01655 [Anaerolineae bacterium]
MKRFVFSTLFVAGLLILMAGPALAHGQKIHVEPETVGPGGTVTVSGEGFEANSTVKITLHGHSGALKVARTDGTGAFVVDVVIPADMPDDIHMLMARDETGEMAQFRLTVDSAVARMPPRATLAYVVGGASVLVLVAGVVGVIMTRKPRRTATAQ